MKYIVWASNIDSLSQRKEGKIVGKQMELIDSNICKPMEAMPHKGTRYLITFIDDFSIMTFVYFSKNKLDALEMFQFFKAYGEK